MGRQGVRGGGRTSNTNWVNEGLGFQLGCEVFYYYSA